MGCPLYLAASFNEFVFNTLDITAVKHTNTRTTIISRYIANEISNVSYNTRNVIHINIFYGKCLNTFVSNCIYIRILFPASSTLFPGARSKEISSERKGALGSPRRLSREFARSKKGAWCITLFLSPCLSLSFCFEKSQEGRRQGRRQGVVAISRTAKRVYLIEKFLCTSLSPLFVFLSFFILFRLPLPSPLHHLPLPFSLFFHLNLCLSLYNVSLFF